MLFLLLVVVLECFFFFFSYSELFHIHSCLLLSACLPKYMIKQIEIHVSCIKDAFKDKQLQIISCLKAEPTTYVPIVLNILRGKNLEWVKARSKWQKIWRDVYRKNYVKSLDRESVVFKEEDKISRQEKSTQTFYCFVFVLFSIVFSLTFLFLFIFFHR